MSKGQGWCTVAISEYESFRLNNSRLEQFALSLVASLTGY